MMFIFRIVCAVFVSITILIIATIPIGWLLDQGVLAYTIERLPDPSTVEIIDIRTGLSLNLVGGLDGSRVSGRSPRWTHDGSAIAFWTFEDRRDASVVEFNPGTSELRDLTALFGYFSLPIYGPDDHMLFSDLPTFQNVPVYIVNQEYPQGQRVTDSTLTPPEWSPDGQSFAYVSRMTQDENNEQISSGVGTENLALYVVDMDGFATREILSRATNIGQPVWSPDGSRIAHVAAQRLSVIDLSSGDIDEPPFPTYAVSAPRWSPDGNYLAFTSNLPSTGMTVDGEIMVLNTTTYDMQNISNLPRYDSDPVWSPDGLHLAFTSLRDGQQSDIYIVNINTSETRRLTYSPGNENDLAWRPR